MPLFLLDEEDFTFPDPDFADDAGLLAIGGDLNPYRLIQAYQTGVFPWFNPGDLPLWWCPDPRYVFFPGQVYVSKTMRQVLRRGEYTVTFDRCFEQVMIACGETPRPGQDGTWITPEFLNAYTELHRLGLAHSVETWKEGTLVGGLYGVSLGKCFFGESMFSRADNASKTALITLSHTLEKHNFWLIDCQMPNPHLLSLGAQGIPRDQFLDYLNRNRSEATITGNWEKALGLTFQ